MLSGQLPEVFQEAVPPGEVNLLMLLLQELFHVLEGRVELLRDLSLDPFDDRVGHIGFLHSKTAVPPMEDAI